MLICYFECNIQKSDNYEDFYKVDNLLFRLLYDFFLFCDVYINDRVG